MSPKPNLELLWNHMSPGRDPLETEVWPETLKEAKWNQGPLRFGVFYPPGSIPHQYPKRYLFRIGCVYGSPRGSKIWYQPRHLRHNNYENFWMIRENLRPLKHPRPL